MKGVSIPHSFLAKLALRKALNNLPNVKVLGLIWDPSSHYGNVENTHGDGFREVDICVGLGLGSGTGLQGCVRPKLRALVCTFLNGNSQEVGNTIVSFIENRRGVTRRSLVAWLEEIDAQYGVAPAWNVWKELNRRGLDTQGVWVPTRG